MISLLFELLVLSFGFWGWTQTSFGIQFVIHGLFNFVLVNAKTKLKVGAAKPRRFWALQIMFPVGYQGKLNRKTKIQVIHHNIISNDMRNDTTEKFTFSKRIMKFRNYLITVCAGNIPKVRRLQVPRVSQKRLVGDRHPERVFQRQWIPVMNH